MATLCLVNILFANKLVCYKKRCIFNWIYSLDSLNKLLFPDSDLEDSGIL
jgi:hypothetical protein